jgi:hypothetical protein
VGVVGLALATGFMIAAGTMLGRAMQDEPAPPPAASPRASMVVVDVPIPTASTTTVPAVPDAGDAIFAAVDECLKADDLTCARNALEPSVFGKTASPFDAQLLYDLCEIQMDKACEQTIAKVYPKVDTSPRRQRTLQGPDGGVAAPGSTSVMDEALQVSLTDPSRARSMLEPRVEAGKGTQPEVALLKTICTAQRDFNCTKMIDKRYPAQASHTTKPTH